jgi:isocitrate dehydrogenase
LKAKTSLLPGEIIDGSVIRIKQLQDFYEQTMQNCDKDTLWSLHLKATMMKVSDPVLFGHAVKVYYKSAFDKHAALFDELGVNVNNGLGDVYAKIAGHPKQAEVEADIMACYNERPAMAYVDSRNGITNLHVPSDVIVDASMAAAVRDSGRMWTKDDTLCDAKFVIPDRCYAGIYDAVIKDCQKNGTLDVSKIGHTSNVGLMAAKAEEYGSHDKTFEVPADGKVQVVLRKGSKDVVLSHDVSKGDIWRMCQTKDAPIQDWVKLAVVRTRSSGAAAIFWLTEERAHDRNMIAKVNEYLKHHDTTGLDIRIMAPEEAMKETLARARQGLDTISVTGNVLRDYLTDLFPILELGTSAKMLSIVPLLAGGGMYETGAGGSAPKHVQQFQKEGHLRWDSLGEFLAMSEALEDLSSKSGNSEAKILSTTLTDAVGKLMNSGKSPKRKVMELDNRGSHFYLALYWSEALAKQSDSPSLASKFAPVASQLKASEARILGELIASEGRPIDLGGYYSPDPFLTSQAMRPSATFNSIIDAILAASGW